MTSVVDHWETLRPHVEALTRDRRDMLSVCWLRRTVAVVARILEELGYPEHKFFAAWGLADAGSVQDLASQLRLLFDVAQRRRDVQAGTAILTAMDSVERFANRDVRTTDVLFFLSVNLVMNQMIAVEKATSLARGASEEREQRTEIEAIARGDHYG